MFDGDIAAGPVPLLFAANPDEAAASIAAEPAKAHFDLSSRVLKFDFYAKRFGEDLTGDPNAPAGVLGPPIPPSTRVKNLRIM